MTAKDAIAVQESVVRTWGALGLTGAKAPMISFPRAAWSELGSAGCLGLSFPADVGGQGASLATVAATAAALARGGAPLGLVLAWLMNEMLGHYAIARLASAEQRASLLPAMARGELLCALSISEPGAGANPKLLGTRAERVPEGWRLNGSKAFVSNGPNADLFIVIAISAEAAGSKAFSAYLVPGDAPGLVRQIHDKQVAGLAPLGHCGLELADCTIGPDKLLGVEGSAFPEFARPFRDVEDALLPGILIGAMARMLASAAVSAIGPDSARQLECGVLLTRLAALAQAARGAADELAAHGVGERLKAINTGFKELANDWLVRWRQVAGQTSDSSGDAPGSGAAAPSEQAMLTQDVNILINIARGVGRTRQQSLGAVVAGDKALDEVALRTSF